MLIYLYYRTGTNSFNYLTRLLLLPNTNAAAPTHISFFCWSYIAHTFSILYIMGMFKKKVGRGGRNNVLLHLELT